ncbi:MAG TPA: hypothetical protein PLL30_04235 [Candidatus Krumholzibacteria bacterium]|nr:hypothetical protein [Candidatus Krumholzibacteria bacterium]HPD70982.1 hypothetical protein [Candidatus Krumholzibacteria bacterium]HRY39318.1 hypothetical protein [Candidatus Krumholzibacteria bacterium]
MPKSREAAASFDALVVVKTPLQILNALEARHHFGFARPALTLLTSRKFPREMLLPLVDPADWAAIRCFELDPYRRPVRLPLVPAGANEELAEIRWIAQQWRLRRRYTAFFRPWRGAADLVIGNYHQAHFRHLANLFRDSRCILVDDGTDTFRVAQARRELAAGALATPAPSPWRTPKKWWLASEVAWNVRPRKNLVFFSTYDLDLAAADTLVRNRYEHAGRQIVANASDGRVLFLGQPLVEDGYLGRSDLRALLGDVRRSHTSQPLAYVPHPREDRAALAGVLGDCGIAMYEIGKPFEFHLLDSTSLPGTVASFFSSALDNCRLIWGNRIRLLAYRIAPERLRTSREFVAEVYAYFASHGRGSIEILEPGQPA